MRPIDRTRAWMARQSRVTLIVGGVFAVVVLGVALLGVARATDQPGFCRACHEMRPYHDAWASGPHSNVSCVECHVDPGTVARLMHKFVALGEVVAHVRGDRDFPREHVEPIPDARCKRCHEQILADSRDFDHEFHASRGPCEKCHATAGHAVSIATLQRAGIYSGVRPRYESADASAVAVIDAGQANLPGHVTVFCSRCHIMASTTCAACHKPPHDPRGACTICHAPGTAFVFAHPENRTDCQSCHTKSATHTTIPGACPDCHKQPGVAWAFQHPAPNANCESCHTRPGVHRPGACSRCHATDENWAFQHAGKGATCTDCHTRPANHDTGPCARCHGDAGVSWAFSHPGASATCTECHNRPRRHRDGACTNCHTVGNAWTFRHPSSTNCAACHPAPANHYGTGCASCHSAARAWASATFSHPRIQGGEHSYRSFACVNCHPGGYSSATCAKCHDTASGPTDEDD